MTPKWGARVIFLVTYRAIVVPNVAIIPSGSFPSQYFAILQPQPNSMVKITGNGAYILYQHEDRFFISVLCGTVGLYELEIELNEEEIKTYLSRDQSFLDDFSRKVSSSPKSYSHRHKPLHAITEERTGIPDTTSPPEETA